MTPLTSALAALRAANPQYGAQITEADLAAAIAAWEATIQLPRLLSAADALWMNRHAGRKLSGETVRLVCNAADVVRAIRALPLTTDKEPT